MNPISLMIWARSDVEDKFGDKWTDQDFMRFINFGARLAQNSTKAVEYRGSFPLVANQRAYPFPEALLLPREKGVTYRTGDAILNPAYTKIPDFQLLEYSTGSSMERYTVVEDQRRFHFYPTPSAASPTTTLTAAVLLGDTTLTVTAVTGWPAGPARVELDTGRKKEVIEYQSINTAGTQLQGCVRGLEGTNRIAHLTGLTVTLRDLEVYGSLRLPPFSMARKTTTGKVTTVQGDETVTGTGTEFSKWVRSGDEFGLTADPYNVDPVTWYKVAYVTSDTALELETQWDEPSVTTAAAFVITAPNPLGDMFDQVIHDFAVMSATTKDGDAKLYQMMQNSISAALGVDSAKVAYDDRDFSVQGWHDGDQGGATRGMKVLNT